MSDATTAGTPQGSDDGAPDEDGLDEHPELAAGDAVPEQLEQEPVITPPVGAPGDPTGSGADA